MSRSMPRSTGRLPNEKRRPRISTMRVVSFIGSRQDGAARGERRGEALRGGGRQGRGPGACGRRRRGEGLERRAPGVDPRKEYVGAVGEAPRGTRAESEECRSAAHEAHVVAEEIA